MLCWILIVGGLLIMMGQHDRSEALFYYFRLEDQVPETHLLRLIEKYISFAFVKERLKASYSDTGRPSIDPELLLRILLIGYLYGITSERKLVEELRMPAEKPNPPQPPLSSETQYAYQYDQYGNWTEQTIVSRSQPDEAFRPGTVIRRKLTYY